MFTCNMIRFYDRENYRAMFKKLEAEGQLRSAILAAHILRTTMGSFTEYFERDFWYYQPAKPFPSVTVKHER